MGHKGLGEPHFLLASTNPFKLMRNLAGVLTAKQIARIDAAINKEARLLFDLGNEHFQFARGITPEHWRQKISRLYYAGYNARRGVLLRHDGSFSTDVSDHHSVDKLPETLNNHATYSAKLRYLRDDRNICDYSHLAKESDLVVPLAEAEALIQQFLIDSRAFLEARGVVW